MKVCPNCKKEISDDSTFCQKCGTKLNENNTENQSEKEIPQSKGFFKKITEGKRKFVLIGIIVFLIAIIALFTLNTTDATYNDGEISFSYYNGYTDQGPNDISGSIVTFSDDLGVSNYEIYKNPSIDGYSIQDYAFYDNSQAAENSTYTNVTTLVPVRIAGTTGYEYEYELDGLKATLVMFEKNGIFYSVFYKFDTTNEFASNNTEAKYQTKKRIFESTVVKTFKVQ